jgi:GH25 family lysozyme M1 (1,4-beta-N-acetylmuramidase)
MTSTSTPTPTTAVRPPAPPATVQGLPLGFDIYVYNGTPATGLQAFVDLRDRGKVFGVNKVSQGTAVDPVFKTRHPLLREAGLLRGTYAFFNGQPVADQTRAVIANVGRLVPGDLAPAIDLEQSASLNARYGDGPGGGQQLFADVKVWLDNVEAALGRTPIIYTWNVWKDRLDPGRVPAAGDMNVYPLWVTQPERWEAETVTALTLPAWTKASIWQYAEEQVGYAARRVAALHKRATGAALTDDETNDAARVTKLWGIDPYTEAPDGRETLDGIDYNAFNGTLYELRGMADMGRPAIALGPSGSAQATTYIAHSERDDTLHMICGPAWVGRDLANDGGLSDLGFDPALLVTAGGLFLYFRNKEQHLIEAFADPNGGWLWNSAPIEDAVPVHDPRVARSGDRRLVVFWGDDDDWHLLIWDGAWTSAGALLSLAGVRSGTFGKASGQPVVYVVQDVIHVVGRVDDGRLIDLRLEGGSWQADDVTELARATNADVPAATYSPSVAQTASETYIVFRGVGGALWVIARSGNTPTHLMQEIPDARLAGGHPTCFALGDVLHVVYRASDQLIYDLFGVDSQWQLARVCSEAAAAEPVADAEGTAAVVAIRLLDGSIQQATYDGSNWRCEATAAAGLAMAPAAPGDLPASTTADGA